jgi:hypothetical protein
MKKLFFILFLLSSILGFSQKIASVRVVSESDSLAFVLKLEDVTVNTLPLKELRVNKCPAGRTDVSIRIANESGFKGFTIYLENGMENSFILGVRDNELQLSPLSSVSLEGKLKELPEGSVYTFNEYFTTEDEGEENSLEIDSTALEFTYAGKKGCSKPTKTAEVKTFANQLTNEFLSSRKMALTERFLENNCVRTNDLASLLAQFEFEDQKLELVKKAQNAVFDLDNLHQLGVFFKLNSNREAFELLLKKL